MPSKPPVKIPSALLKKPVKDALALVNEAIAQGTAAVAASETAMNADPGNETKKLRHRQNEELLTKAKYLKSGLDMSEELANFMCPQQVAMLEFDYLD